MTDVASQSAPKAVVAMDSSIASVVRDPACPFANPPLVKAPPELPGRGDVLSGISDVVRMQRHGVKAMLARRERYGDIYRFRFLTYSAVYIWDPEQIAKIARNEERAWSTGLGYDTVIIRGVDDRQGNMGGLVSTDFDVHRNLRKFVQPAFTVSALAGYIEMAQRRFERVVLDWIEKERVAFKPAIRRTLASVSSDIFTGVDDAAQAAMLDRALVDFWSAPFALFENPWLSRRFRRSRRGYKVLIEHFTRLVPERRRHPGRDLFSRMCQVQDEALDDEGIARLFLGVMGAAFDTTSLGITSMAYLLAKHPEWQERLREEVLAMPAEGVQWEHLRGLDQMERVWKETLRLMPVAVFLPRRALRAVEVGPYTVPAGTLALVAAGPMGRHPKWWKDPERFDPERFAPGGEAAQQPVGVDMPFGAGAHACVGMQLATLEAKVFWHAMLTRCRFRLARDYDAEHTYAPLGCVSGDVQLIVEPYTPKSVG